MRNKKENVILPGATHDLHFEVMCVQRQQGATFCSKSPFQREKKLKSANENMI